MPTNSSRLPQKGVRLFRPDDTNWVYNACLNYMHDGWRLYSTGYKEATDALVRETLKDSGTLDTNIYSIVFGYRLYIELMLKRLIQEGNHLLDRVFDVQRLFGGHNIGRLWTDLKTIMADLGGEKSVQFEDITTDVLEAVDERINEFMALDPGSDSFRFPVNKQNQASLPAHLTHVSIRHLADGMNDLATFFDWVAYTIDAHIEFEQEMMSYYGP